MTLLTFIAITLAELFAFATETWSRQAGGLDTDVDLSASAALLRGDLESCYTGRPASWVSYDADHPGLGHLTADLEVLYPRLFQQRMLMPMEVDREAGKDKRVSLPHAEEHRVGGRRHFSTLAFAAVKPGSGALYPTSLHRERHGEFAPFGGEPVMAADLSLIGYYVAYTSDSPLAVAPGRSMKLYRHYRPAGLSLGVGQAGSTIRWVSEAVNRQHVPQVEFANRDLGYLMAYHAPNPGNLTRVEAERPWPMWGEYRPAGMMPDREDVQLWRDADSALHKYQYPVAPVVQNVVRFEVRPYRRIEVGGKVELMDGPRLAQYLKLPDAEWPVLVAPDVVEVVLAVIPPEAAASLLDREDWLVAWDGEEIEGPETPAKRVIRRTVRTYRFQAHLGTAS